MSSHLNISSYCIDGRASSCIRQIRPLQVLQYEEAHLQVKLRGEEAEGSGDTTGAAELLRKLLSASALAGQPAQS